MRDSVRAPAPAAENFATENKPPSQLCRAEYHATLWCNENSVVEVRKPNLGGLIIDDFFFEVECFLVAGTAAHNRTAECPLRLRFRTAARAFFRDGSGLSAKKADHGKLLVVIGTLNLSRHSGPPIEFVGR